MERVRLPWEQLRLRSLSDLSEMLGEDERRAAAAHACLRAVPHYIL